MASRVIIYPYKIGSKSAVRLQEYIDDAGMYCMRVYPDGDYAPRKNDLIIGWGSGNWPHWRDKAADVKAKWYNKSDSICNAVNKITSFKKFKANDVPHPEFTDNKKVAANWMKQGSLIVVRSDTEGMDGKGLKIIDDIYDFFDITAPLYTKFIPQQNEYRVHVFNGNVIDLQIKRPRDGVQKVNERVRTTSGGWGLYRSNVNCPQECQNAAIRAVKALGLDFGAVDVVWQQGGKGAFVLEVNTAPELTEVCTEKYGDYIIKLAKGS